MPGFTGPLLYCRPRPLYILQPHGQVAEWLCSGLQSRLPRFDSGPGLQIQAAKSRHRAGFFLFSAFLAACYTLGRSVSRPFLPEPAARAVLAERMISAVSPSRRSEERRGGKVSGTGRWRDRPENKEEK